MSLQIALREENDELRERVRQLTEQLASTSFQFPPEARLTPTQSTITRHLLTRDLITRESTNTLLYSARASDEPLPNNIDVQISRIREKLVPYGIQIENIYGKGWRIVDRAAAAARFK